MKTRKIPMRKCIGCMESFPKKELCRIVKNKDNEINFDSTGKMNGRGTYICKKTECFDKAVKSKRLSKSLEAEIPNEVYEAIKAEIAKNE
ncbi:MULTISPECIES: RNase P modulator RnpM [unclassified Sedimentibacter]|uniref:RNase P modulator RnpM n=1 Tax=unclassified Sedimentibacter TaxID=2649220 RepID=UPI0027DF4DF6|nr:YlxR family protein [Sedimentibacter sp. MB35-C1]WMJ76142.1 YlxR family protein [Sedimentibacter sp. MB35-C1]